MAQERVTKSKATGRTTATAEETAEARKKREALLAKVDEAAASIDEVLEANEAEMEAVETAEEREGREAMEEFIEAFFDWISATTLMLTERISSQEQEQPCDTCACGFPQAMCVKNGPKFADLYRRSSF